MEKRISCIPGKGGATKTIAADTGFQQFFHTDTTCLQGYIDGYDRRLGFDTGLIYLSNHITRQDYPTVIQIDEDGSFLCKFVIKHPVEQSVTLDNNWIPFYIEPGQTLTMYIDWEAVNGAQPCTRSLLPYQKHSIYGSIRFSLLPAERL